MQQYRVFIEGNNGEWHYAGAFIAKALDVEKCVRAFDHGDVQRVLVVTSQWARVVVL